MREALAPYRKAITAMLTGAFLAIAVSGYLDATMVEQIVSALVGMLLGAPVYQVPNAATPANPPSVSRSPVLIGLFLLLFALTMVGCTQNDNRAVLITGGETVEFLQDATALAYEDCHNDATSRAGEIVCLDRKDSRADQLSEALSLLGLYAATTIDVEAVEDGSQLRRALLIMAAVRLNVSEFLGVPESRALAYLDEVQ